MAIPENLKNVGGSVLPVNLVNKQNLYKAYMPFIQGGALFVQTDKKYSLGEEVFLLIKLIDEPHKFPVAGKVVWITPPAAQAGRATGIGVQFKGDQSVEIANKIQNYLAGGLQSDHHTETM